jgi:catechol-2,3-dioxygenase
VTISGLNHAVLYVRDADAAARWYGDALGFEVVTSFPGAAFLRASGSANHHDLGLFSVGAGAPGPERDRVGLYHLAWEVPTIEELAEAARRLSQLGALVGASDHGASKSLYAHDLDGNEFEVMWAVPRDEWTPEIEHGAPVRPLDLAAELERWGAGRQNSGSSHQG